MALQLRQTLFWEYDVTTIDLDAHKQTVIARITLRGQWQEFKAMLTHYGKNTVRDCLLDLRNFVLCLPRNCQ